MRDSQRSKVYAAEQEMGFKLREDREFPDTAACEGYLRSVLENIWVRQDFGDPLCRYLSGKLRVVQTRRRSWARAYGAARRIEMPTRPWAWNHYVLLHELAHLIMFLGPARNVRVHGPEFCWAFLRLLQHAGEPGDCDCMKMLFRVNHVRFCRESPIRIAASHQ